MRSQTIDQHHLNSHLQRGKVVQSAARSPAGSNGPAAGKRGESCNVAAALSQYRSTEDWLTLSDGDTNEPYGGQSLRRWRAQIAAVLVAVFLVAGAVAAPSAAQTGWEGTFVAPPVGGIWLITGKQKRQLQVQPISQEEFDQFETGEGIAGVWQLTSSASAEAPQPPASSGTPAQLPSPAAAATTLAAPSTPARSVRWNGLTMTVQAIERGWRSSNRSVQPKSGQEFLTVQIRIDNASGQTQAWSYVQLKAVTADGSRWDTEPNWREPKLGTGNLAPGDFVVGWVVFEVPVGSQVVALEWRPKYDTTLRIAL